MKHSLNILILFLFLGTSCNGPQEKNADFAAFEVKRGTNIAHFLSQSDRRGDARAEFFTQEDVKLIASLGFDHIRLPIDEEQMWDEDMNKHMDAFSLLHNTIEWCQEEGLRVIVDLHILRSHHFNHGEKPLWTDPAEQERFIKLWEDLSAELSAYPNGQVAYEFMNEAVADDPELWNDLIARVHAKVRELEPERTVVIGSNMWQSVNTFSDLRIPANDKHILLSFHFYLPFAFTHYQAGWTGIKDYDGPVHYPGEVIEEIDLQGYEGSLLAQLKGGAGFFTADTLEILMQEPVEFARKHGLPLYCGEFGVYSKSPREDALLWYEDMVRVLEKQDIAWANWCYKGSFGIFDEDESVDQDLLSAFFQNADRQ